VNRAHIAFKKHATHRNRIGWVDFGTELASPTHAPTPGLALGRKRSTEHLWHFCQSSGTSGIYATRLSMVWQAAGRALIQLTGSRALWSPAGGLCISFSMTHSK
jgi:hypothetical protein